MHVQNVTEIVVPADMCVGCGICAGICPHNVLEMKMQNGQYVPMLMGHCAPRCTMCLVSCPFFDHPDSLDDVTERLFGEIPEIHYDRMIGYWLSCYVGYSEVNGHRENGASGGMVTWLLEQLLTSNEIDGIVSVRARPSVGSPLFEMTILRNIEDVRKAASSRYYPVELSSVLHKIRAEKSEVRYAIVGVPCFINGIRRAMTVNRKLSRRIRYLFGLACGLCPTALYTECMSLWTGVSPREVRTVGYRFKDDIGVGWNYRFRAQRLDGEWSEPIGQFETFSYLWDRYYFSHNTCLYCDDVYAEAADIVFMDAWLPDYLPDTRGTSIMVVRNPILQQILEKGNRDKTCDLLPCSIQDVLASQKAVIHKKRETLAARITVANEQHRWLPGMRVKPQGKLRDDERATILRTLKTVRMSRRVWPCFRNLPPIAIPIFLLVVDTLSGGLRYGIRTLRLLFSRGDWQRFSVRTFAWFE